MKIFLVERNVYIKVVITTSANYKIHIRGHLTRICCLVIQVRNIVNYTHL